MKYFISALALVLAGCGQPAMLNGKPVLSISPGTSPQSYLFQGAGAYSNVVCLQNSATRYCVKNFGMGATLTLQSPTDPDTATGMVSCAGLPTPTELDNAFSSAC